MEIFEFKKILPTQTPLDKSDLIRLHQKYASRFMKEWSEIDVNLRYWMGENWTEEEKIQAYNEDKFKLESLPAVQSKLRHIVGAFKQIRTSYKVEAKTDPQDEIKAKLAELRLRDIESRSGAKYLDSRTFEEGLVLKYGVRKIEVVNVDGIDMLKIKRVNPKNFVWDLGAETFIVNEEARWMAEIEYLTEKEIKTRYPNVPDSYFDKGVSFFDRPDSEYFQYDEEGKTYYSLFHHYQKVTKKYYYVVFPDIYDIIATDVITERFDSREEAEQKLEEYRRTYRNLALQLPEEAAGYVQEGIENRIEYYAFTYYGILEYGVLKPKDFPYNVFFTIKLGDRFVSFLDYLKGTQRIFDRMWAQLLYSLKTSIRNTYQANINLIDKSESAESVTRKLSTDGGIIWTYAANNEEIVKPIRKAPIEAAWGQVAAGMLSYIEDFAGGRTFFGLSQGEESGRAIYNKVAQGQLLASTMFDAFNEFKRAVGRNLLNWLQYVDTEVAIFKTEGSLIDDRMRELLANKGLYEEIDPRSRKGYVYANIPEIPESMWADADLELEVLEEGLSENERERRWYQMIEAERTDATGTLVMLPSWLEMKLEVMNVDPDIKHRLIQELREQRQMAQQAAQEQANIEKAKVLANMRNQDMNAMMQAQNQTGEIQVNPNP